MTNLGNSIGLRIVVFTIVLLLGDRIIGYSLQKFYKKTNEYSISKLRFSLDSTDQDLLIFGSSRAEHHYDPLIISKNTCLTVYNCGFPGQGLDFTYIQLYETFKRYKPKFVIVDISPNILSDQESNIKSKLLLPYYKKDTLIYNFLTNRSIFEKAKFLSKIYPYNSTILSILRGFIFVKKDLDNGYIRLNGQINIANSYQNNIPIKNIDSVDLDKIFYQITSIVSLCSEYKSPIIFVVSPIYAIDSVDVKIVNHINHYCIDNAINFLDCSKDSLSSEKHIFFRDNLHMNYHGAEIFSNSLSLKLKKLII